MGYSGHGGFGGGEGGGGWWVVMVSACGGGKEGKGKVAVEQHCAWGILNEGKHCRSAVGGEGLLRIRAMK